MADPSPDLLKSLAHLLGFMKYPEDESATPYLEYIIEQGRDDAAINDYIRLFKDVVEYFANSHNDPTIGSYIFFHIAEPNHYYFNDPPSSDTRADDVTDTILYILGIWTLMKRYFEALRGDLRHVVWAYCIHNGKPVSETFALGETLPWLLAGSRLLPSGEQHRYGAKKDGSSAVEPIEVLLKPFATPDWSADEDLKAALRSFIAACTSTSSLVSCAALLDLTSSLQLHASLDLIESLFIDPSVLNAFKLLTLANVHIHWMDNISWHLLLSIYDQQYYLEVFALPSAIQDGGENIFHKIGISRKLMDEIQDSYAALFNPQPPSYLHNRLGKLVELRFWCW